MPIPMLDVLWLVLCAGLVFNMQIGFLCLESGLTRSKNAINVAVKNMADLSVAIFCYWLFGFGLMFGATAGDCGLLIVVLGHIGRLLNMASERLSVGSLASSHRRTW